MIRRKNRSTTNDAIWIFTVKVSASETVGLGVPRIFHLSLRSIYGVKSGRVSFVGGEMVKHIFSTLSVPCHKILYKNIVSGVLPANCAYSRNDIASSSGSDPPVYCMMRLRSMRRCSSIGFLDLCLRGVEEQSYM